MEAGEILLRRGLLNRRQLEESRQKKQDGASLVDAAIELGFVDEEPALRALAEEVGLDYIDLSSADIDLSLLKDFQQVTRLRQLRKQEGSQCSPIQPL